MERRMAEVALDDMHHEESRWLRVIALHNIERLVDVLAKDNILGRTDSDPKPGEMDDEAERRNATLRRVKATQVVATLFALAAITTAGVIDVTIVSSSRTHAR